MPELADPVLRNPNLPAARASKRRARAEEAVAPAPAPAPAPISEHEDTAAPEVFFDDTPLDGPELPPEDAADQGNDTPEPAAPVLAKSDVSEKLDRALQAIEALRDENRRLKSEKTPEPTPEPKKKRLKLDADPDDPNAEQAIAEFLGEHKGTIEKLIDRRIASKIGPVLEQVEALIEQVEGNVGEVTGVTAETLQRTFHEALKSKFPDFDTLTKSEPFGVYMREQAPMMRRGVTVGMVLSQAWKDRDLDVTVEAIQRYKDRQRQAAAGRPNPASFEQPTSSRASAPVATPRAPRQLKQSEWDTLRAKHRRGEISSQEFRQKSAAFLAAAEQGRLINDVAAQSSATP